MYVAMEVLYIRSGRRLRYEVVGKRTGDDYELASGFHRCWGWG